MGSKGKVAGTAYALFKGVALMNFSPSVLKDAGQQVDATAEEDYVLVVDDSEALVSLIGEFLGAVLPRWRVLCCGAGAGAVALARQHRPKLILLDMVLPDLHGSEVCRLLAEDPLTAGIPVVLMSGMSPSAGWNEAGNVVQFLPKPFPLGTLACVVQRALPAA
jgi:CheY-like chemotaxis protein